MTITDGALGVIEDGDEGDNWFPECNELFRAITAFAGTIKVLDKDTATPPGSPSHGDAYIIATGGTGAWSTHDKKIARYNTYDAANTWDIYPVREGMFAWVADEDKLYYHNGTSWAEFAQGGGASALNDLSDVDTSGLASGDVLTYNGSTWVPETPAAATFTGVRVRNNANFTVTHNTVTAITFNTEDFDTDAFHDTGSNTNRLTVPSGKAGKYAIYGCARWAANAVGTRSAAIRLNGTTNITGQGGETDTTSNVFTNNLFTVYDLAVGDYVELLVFQTSGGNLNVETNESRSPVFGMFLIQGGSGASGSTEGQDTAAGTIYVTTTGNDTTGDGSVGAPYLTVGKALSTLPRSIGFVQTIDVANGTYAEAITVDDFTCTGAGKIVITGDTTTPANVSFTGTVSNTDRGQSLSSTVYVKGPVVVELEGVRVNATADHGVTAVNGATLIVDRSTVTGTLSKGVAVWNQSRAEFHGNCTVSGFSSRGIQIGFSSSASYLTAGTLTITGSSSSTSWGFHVVQGSEFGVFSQNASGLNITITVCLIGIQVGLTSAFTHQGPSATITIDNVTTPASSAAVQCTDCSSFSTTQTLVLDNFTNGFELNSISYAEARGTRTFTNLGSTSSVTQNSVYYAP